MQHVVADYLSGLDSREPTNTTYDDLPDTNVFGLTTTTKQDNTEDEWIHDITHFLTTGLPPKHLPLDAKR